MANPRSRARLLLLKSYGLELSHVVTFTYKGSCNVYLYTQAEEQVAVWCAACGPAINTNLRKF